MVERKQAALAHKEIERQESPLRDYMRLYMARVTNTYPEHGLVDVTLLRGGINLRYVPVIGASGGTSAGQNGLPQVWNSDVATQKDQTTDRGSNKPQIYDEPKKTYKYDVFCVVGYLDGYHNQPVVMGFLNPNSHQSSFHEPNMNVERKATDVHELHWSEPGIDIRPPPFGDGQEGDDHPEEVHGGNWQQIFPDRAKDWKVAEKERKFGNDRQTFISVGYHDKPRVFGDGTSEGSGNFDRDKNPWKLSQTEKGNDDKNLKWSRGITLSQRFRSSFRIDPKGNVDLHAEGRGYDSTSYVDKKSSEGRFRLWSRLDFTSWQKHAGFWTRMRPRFDGKDPESVKTAKETGSWTQRIQRFWDVAVRKDAEFRIKDSFTLNVGDFPSKWNEGDLGSDPGISWDDELTQGDDPALNEEFKSKVSDDDEWKGESFQDSGNIHFHQNRRTKAKAKGQLSFDWLMDPAKPSTDTSWTQTQKPFMGNTFWQTEQMPSSGKTADHQTHLDATSSQMHLDHHTDPASASTTLTLKNGSYIVDEIFTVTPAGGHVHLDVAGPRPVGIDYDSATGNVTLTGDVYITGNLYVGGILVEVP